MSNFSILKILTLCVCVGGGGGEHICWDIQIRGSGGWGGGEEGGEHICWDIQIRGSGGGGESTFVGTYRSGAVGEGEEGGEHICWDIQIRGSGGGGGGGRAHLLGHTDQGQWGEMRWGGSVWMCQFFF